MSVRQGHPVHRSLAQGTPNASIEEVLVVDNVTHGHQVAAAIAARGEQIKTNSAEFLWICRGVRPALPPPDKPTVVARNSSGPEVIKPR
jgi:hypothetical protein